MRNKLLIGVVAIILFAISAGSSYLFFSATEKTPAAGSGTGTKIVQSLSVGTTIDPSEPRTEACPMNGELYPKSQKAIWEQRRPMGIMVENHTEARPQSGLSSADVTYEAVAEGGITRFLNIFYCQDAAYVGPVRSARIYFLDILEGYGDHPLYAHVGGANTDGPADALGEIDKLGWAGYNDLNQFSVPFPYYWRDYERLPDRATEHTVYTNSAKLFDFAKTKRNLTNVDAKGNAWDADFTPWKFKDDAKAADRGTVTNISFYFWKASEADFGVKYHYDASTNSYKRENGGAPHIDKNTGKQLEAKDVVIVFAEESVANDGYEAGQHMLYGVIGKGDGLLFQDGNSEKITWSKPKASTMMTFKDASGKEVQFTRGHIWVEILPIGNKVTY